MRRLRYAPLVLHAAALSLWFQLKRPWRHPSTPPRHATGSIPAGTITTAVRIATALPPLKGTCMSRAATLARLLNRNGHHAEAVIGLPPNADPKTQRRFAHAWVEMGQRTNEDFQELVRFTP